MRLNLLSSEYYAIQAMVFMANGESDKSYTSTLISDGSGIPGRFGLKIFKGLAQAGLLSSSKGPNGGYRLQKTPKEITLLNILEAVAGPVNHQGNGHLKSKVLDAVCGQAQESVRKHLSKVKLSDLLGEKVDGK